MAPDLPKERKIQPIGIKQALKLGRSDSYKLSTKYETMNGQ